MRRVKTVAACFIQRESRFIFGTAMIHMVVPAGLWDEIEGAPIPSAESLRRTPPASPRIVGRDWSHTGQESLADRQ